MKVLLVSHFMPDKVGHGGNHRSYQVRHDLESIFGQENVLTFYSPQWQDSHPSRNSLSPFQNVDACVNSLRRFGRHSLLLRVLSRAYRRLESRFSFRKIFSLFPFLFVEHPIEFLIASGHTIKRFSITEFINHYEVIIQNLKEPAVCIIEHTGFSQLLPINFEYGIPTISCIHNLEAFDTASPLHKKPIRETYLTAIDFADEFNILAKCDERFFISKVEAGIIEGLGLHSYYYPYIPVGEIRQHLETIRQIRAIGKIDPNLFLMLGSCGHTTTRESFSWFINNCRSKGLPKGTKMVVAGSKTNELIPNNESIQGIELKGWLDSEELDKLLIRVRAVLAPQMIGFGALTRLPELSCAGIPVIVSKHPTYSIDSPPGISVVEDDWAAWCKQIELTKGENTNPHHNDYLTWEKRQSANIRTVLSKVLCIGLGDE